MESLVSGKICGKVDLTKLPKIERKNNPARKNLCAGKI